ncbi:GEM-like protein 5 [Tanacetum coccineum]
MPMMSASPSGLLSSEMSADLKVEHKCCPAKNKQYARYKELAMLWARPHARTQIWPVSSMPSRLLIAMYFGVVTTYDGSLGLDQLGILEISSENVSMYRVMVNANGLVVLEEVEITAMVNDTTHVLIQRNYRERIVGLLFVDECFSWSQHLKVISPGTSASIYSPEHLHDQVILRDLHRNLGVRKGHPAEDTPLSQSGILTRINQGRGNLNMEYDQPLCFTAPSGQETWSYYKVVMALGNIGTVNPTTMSENPSERYIQIVVVDGHDFWFMRFVNYDKASRHYYHLLTFAGEAING